MSNDNLMPEEQAERRQIQRRVQLEKDSQDIVDRMSDFINILGGEQERIDALIDKMSRSHRTLQQGYTRLCLAWLQHLASLKEGQYDLRNEDSVKIARRLLQDMDKYDLHLRTV